MTAPPTAGRGAGPPRPHPPAGREPWTAGRGAGPPRSGGAGCRGPAGREHGQATVELVLAFPVVLVLVVAVVQAMLVVRDQLVVVHAAREAARAASVHPDPSRPAAAAAAVMPGTVVRPLRRPPPGELVTVEVVYRSPTDLPVVGPLLPDPELSARAVMRVEQ